MHLQCLIQPCRRFGAATMAVLAVVGLLAGTSAPAVTAQEWAPPRTVWVEQSGHTVDGLFLDTWRFYSPLLGVPIAEETKQRVGLDGLPSAERPIQYFENLALVYTPEDERGGPYQVQALPLGEAALKRDREDLRKRDLEAKGSCTGFAEADCLLLSETGHSVRLGFKTFWESNDGERLIGLPLTEEFAGPDGRTLQYFERAVLQWDKESDVTPRAVGKEAAKRAKIQTKQVAQPSNVPVYDEALFVPPPVEEESVGGDTEEEATSGPGPLQGGAKEIVVSVSQQYLWAYENGEVVTETYVSTGTGNVPETVTPTGSFSVVAKYESETMEGTISEEYYLVEDVPYVMYFDGDGNALHGTYWHSNFGTPMSHGCVNLPVDVAAFLYGWAPEGTPVTVID